MDVQEKLKSNKAARMQRVKEIKDMSAVQRVRVEPTKEEYRKVLRHPSNNTAFRETGSIEWPLDQFTKRRIREGAIRIAESREPAGGEQAARGSGDIKDKSNPGKTAATAQEPLSSQEPTSNKSGQGPSKVF
jgi:hypothetical protein